ncbi:MAG: hypothetical protein Q9202_006228 [Teloschistes flavicans]
MTDTAALAALIVAAVALLIALVQLTQQLLSTAYVIRKCDRIVTGGLTRGGTRQFHWRQFRFTVRYQTLVFALPWSVYESLGITSTVQPTGVSEKQGIAASKAIVERAVKTRQQRSSAQACWVSLVQDLALSGCLVGGDTSTKEETGDRIPDDLTVAPMRVDSMTLLLSCIAMGMQVFKYSPTTGEITLSGGLGSVSSSAHPILGGLLHYSVFADEPNVGLEVVKNHARALRGTGGVWANAVFGRFIDRSYRPQMVSFYELIDRKIPLLRASGWPEDAYADKIGGAACFLVFGDVNVYLSAPPSVIRQFNAHFAEVIVRAHHLKLLQLSRSDVEWYTDNYSNPQAFSWITEVDKIQYSSPHHWWLSTIGPRVIKELGTEGAEASRLVVCPSLIELVERSEWMLENDDTVDPSSYCPVSTMWDLICIADICRSNIYRNINNKITWNERKSAQRSVEKMVAVSISKIAHVGPPSWGNASTAIKEWPQMFITSCDEAWPEIEKETDVPMQDMKSYRRMVTLCAEFSILRSAYHTVMMRAAHPLGPGLVEGMSIETSLTYMA